MDIYVVLRPVILLSLLTVAAVTDVLKHKVSNQVIALGFIAESAVHLLSKSGIESEQLGYAVLFIIILFILFAMRLMGGADVKLYALCIFTYPNETGLRIICLSVIIGALYAVPILMKQGSLAARYVSLFRYIMSFTGINPSGSASDMAITGGAYSSVPMAAFILAGAVLAVI